MPDDRMIPAAIEMEMPLAALYLSPLNPRQSPDPDEDIDLLAQSIRVCGLIQNLAGLRDEDGRVGIVAGGRRLRALQRLAERGELATDLIPVRITDNAMNASAWAGAEQVSHRALDPADEVRAYGQLRDTGAPASSIARAFGVTERHVARRLALADLPAAILDALKAREITLDQAAAFTTATDEQLALDTLDRVRGTRYSPDTIRTTLNPEAVQATDRRVKFIGLATYIAEGGRTTDDLFADACLCHDVALIDKLVHRRLDDEAKRLRAEGWGKVTIDDGAIYRHGPRPEPDLPAGTLPEDEAQELAALVARVDADEDLTDEEDARLDELTDRQLDLETGLHRYSPDLRARCWIDLRAWSDLRIEGPRLIPETAAASPDTAPGEAPAPVIEKGLSNALVEELDTIRLAALQAACLPKTELMLDLLAAHLLTDSYDRPFDDMLRPTLPPAAAEIDGLRLPPGLTGEGQPDRHRRAAEAVAAVRDGGKAQRNATLAAALARSLISRGVVEDGLQAEIEAAVKSDPRSIWTPGVAFFKRCPAPWLDRLFDSLTGLDQDDPNRTTFHAANRATKARTLADLFGGHEAREALGLSRDQGRAIDAWLPAEMGMGAAQEATDA